MLNIKSLSKFCASLFITILLSLAFSYALSFVAHSTYNTVIELNTALWAEPAKIMHTILNVVALILPTFFHFLLIDKFKKPEPTPS